MFLMNKAFKIALGIGAAAAAAALAISISKKSSTTYSDEMDSDETGRLNKCDGCDSWNGDECGCDDDCGSCSKCSDGSDLGDEEEGSAGISMSGAVNNIIDGVMGGIVVAADKVSEVSTKIADYVATKLDERRDSYCEPISFSFDDDDAEETLAQKAKEFGEDAADAVKNAASKIKDAAEDAFKN